MSLREGTLGSPYSLPCSLSMNTQKNGHVTTQGGRESPAPRGTPCLHLGRLASGPWSWPRMLAGPHRHVWGLLSRTLETGVPSLRYSVFQEDSWVLRKADSVSDRIFRYISFFYTKSRIEISITPHWPLCWGPCHRRPVTALPRGGHPPSHQQ